MKSIGVNLNVTQKSNPYIIYARSSVSSDPASAQEFGGKEECINCSRK